MKLARCLIGVLHGKQLLDETIKRSGEGLGIFDLSR